MKDILRKLSPWIALLAFSIVLISQRIKISNLETRLSESSDESSELSRSRRSTDDIVYLPVYAHISKKAMKRLCMKEVSTRPIISKHKISTKDKSERKRCSKEVSFSLPSLIAIRPNLEGSFIRDGESLYLTEFSLGYSILQFSSIRSLNLSQPHSIRTLPYPFYGTDNIVYNNSVYYNNDNSLIVYHLKTGYTKQLVLNISMSPLYNNSKSYLDIQADEHGMWILYRKKSELHLTVTRIHPTSLKSISSWSLSAVNPSQLCNSFIRCGLLYAVECTEDKSYISPLYDFYDEMYVGGRRHEWKGLSSLSSVQYDPLSKTLAIFSNGSIYSVDVV